MEKGQPFFDPYNFNLQNMQQSAPGMGQPNQMMPDMDMMAGNPAMYYEQQYMYYRYLTQVLEYRIKLKEWENLNREPKQTK